MAAKNPDGSTATLSGGFTFTAPTSCTGTPPYPCSRTDFLAAQLPITIPNLGNLIGANTIITDPDFNNRIVRVTDAQTNPQKPNFTFATSASADVNKWNNDATLFVLEDGGALGYPFSFDPTTMQASRLYVSNFPATGGMTLSFKSESWSHINSNLLYANSGTTPEIDSLDFTDRTTPPTANFIYNFTSSSKCLPSSFNTVTWVDPGEESADDTVFARSYSNSGGQGTGGYVVAYKVGSGCSFYNTQTGQVGGDWGSTGTVTIPDRFSVHNNKISKDGNWAVITMEAGTCKTACSDAHFWQIGTTNVQVCQQGVGYQCSGHWTEGYTHWVNNSGIHEGSEEMRLFATPTAFQELITNYPPGMVSGSLDTHQSWNNANATDSNPFVQSTESSLSPFPAAWYDEILGTATDGSGTVWRFAHNFITHKSQRFSAAHGIGSVSQDGRFFIFSSDWMGTLGSESGSSTCTIGTDCRGDVFIVELK